MGGEEALTCLIELRSGVTVLASRGYDHREARQALRKLDRGIPSKSLYGRPTDRQDRQAAASGLASYDDPLRHTILRQAAYFFVAAGAGAFFAAGATGSGKITVADLILSSSGKFLSR